MTASTPSERVFAFDNYFLRMEPKSFRLHTTKGANDHIKQGDTVFFAGNPIGIACNQLPAMLTNTAHKSP